MRALTLPALGAVLTALLLTGCGTSEEGGSGGTAGAETGGEKSMEDAVLEFAACMRDNGVDMPDPEGQGMPSLPVTQDEEMEAAMEACEDLLPVDENAPTEQEAFEHSLELAECLRDNGVDVPDPELGELLDLPQNPDDEEMEAFATCTEDSVQVGEPEDGS